MKHLPLLLLTTTLLFSASTTLTGCSSDATNSEGTAGNNATGGAKSQDSGTPDSTAHDGSAGGSSSQDSGTPDSTAHDGGNGDGSPPQKCSDLPADDCFSNFDCNKATDRCDNVGTENMPLACCVPGARGTSKPGDACTDSNECESGVCIEGNGKQLCSGTCKDKTDCPDGMKDCKHIAFSSSPDDWCFPSP